MSQELRFTSPSDRRVRWIFGAYAISTDRYISTGNVIDIGDGIVPEVRRTPLTKFDLATNCFPPACRQFTLSRGLAGQLRLGGVRRPELRHHRPARRLGGAALRRGRAREHDRDAGEFPADADCVPGPGAQAHLGRAAAEGHAALQARGRSHAGTSATAAASAAAASIRPASARPTLPASTTCSTRRPRTPTRRASRASSWTGGSPPT